MPRATSRQNHVIEYPDPNVAVCRRLKILPVEMAVRDYMAGTTSTSIWSMYKQGKREMYGTRFPMACARTRSCAQTIITPTTKADQGDHDAPLTAGRHRVARLADASAMGRSLPRWRSPCSGAASQIALNHGLILVDTKYEFGFDESGRIVLADEIHTPDSSRYWFAKSYPERFAAGQRPQSFDKDFVRTWVTARCDPYKDKIPEIPPQVIADAARVYIQAYEMITGKTFNVPDQPVPVLERIRANLAKYSITCRLGADPMLRSARIRTGKSGDAGDRPANPALPPQL